MSNMNWQEYNICLMPIQKRFGKYSETEIKEGFRYWKPMHQDELVKYISDVIGLSSRPPIIPTYTKPVTSSSMVDTKNKWKEELINRVINNDHLDKILSAHGASSLVELVFKNKKTP